ncbi:hypothetical protein ABPG72_008887 [Tetrahymena utriculariae]
MKHQITKEDLKNSEADNTEKSQENQSAAKVKPISVNTQDAKVLIEILQIPADNRRPEHIQIMKECLRKVKFLQSYQDSTHYAEVLKNLELESWPLDHILFRQGDVADKFYIILNGIIGLYVRTANDADTFIKIDQNKNQNQTGDSSNQQNENDKNVQQQKKENSPNKSVSKSQIIENKGDNISQNILGVGVREVARLESGDAFGELGLLFNENRTATAVCLDTTNLLVLKKQIFEKYLSQSKNAKISIMVDFYTNLWQMREMQQKDILKLSTKTTLTQCSKNIIIIKQGEKPKGIFFVRNGIVKLVTTLKFRIDYKSNSILDDYKDPTPEEIRLKRYKTIDVQLEEIGNGNVFGDYEVFNNQEIPYTAVSTTDCDILTITLQDLKSCVTQDVFKQFESSIKHYPSNEKIKRQYIENIMWNNYKNDIVQSFNNELVNSVRQANIFQHRLPFLPKVTLDKYQIYDEINQNREIKKNHKQNNLQNSNNENQINFQKNSERSSNQDKNSNLNNLSFKASVFNKSIKQIQRKLSAEESSTPNMNSNNQGNTQRDIKTSILNEFSQINKLERQEDYLNSMLLKQTDMLQHKTKGVDSFQTELFIHKYNNKKNPKQSLNSKPQSKLASSRSDSNLLKNKKINEEKQQKINQNQSLQAQKNMIDQLISSGLLIGDSKKLNSLQSNNQDQYPKKLTQNHQSNKYILPRINKQSKVSLLANEIY